MGNRCSIQQSEEINCWLEQSPENRLYRPFRKFWATLYLLGRFMNEIWASSYHNYWQIVLCFLQCMQILCIISTRTARIFLPILPWCTLFDIKNDGGYFYPINAIFTRKIDLLLRIYLSQRAKQEMNKWRSYSNLRISNGVKSWKNPQFTQYFGQNYFLFIPAKWRR